MVLTAFCTEIEDRTGQNINVVPQDRDVLFSEITNFVLLFTNSTAFLRRKRAPRTLKRLGSEFLEGNPSLLRHGWIRNGGKYSNPIEKYGLRYSHVAAFDEETKLIRAVLPRLFDCVEKHLESEQVKNGNKGTSSKDPPSSSNTAGPSSEILNNTPETSKISNVENENPFNIRTSDMLRHPADEKGTRFYNEFPQKVEPHEEPTSLFTNRVGEAALMNDTSSIRHRRAYKQNMQVRFAEFKAQNKDLFDEVVLDKFIEAYASGELFTDRFLVQGSSTSAANLGSSTTAAGSTEWQA